MIKEDAINYLENLEQGRFITVNIPIIAEEKIQVTAMYMGKDKEGRYKFKDAGNLVLSKDFLERGNISIDKEYDGIEEDKIYKKVRKENEKKQRKSRER